MSAGMDLVHATDDRRDGWEEINRTRDYIVEHGVVNDSAGGNVIGLSWEGGRIIVRVDVTDVLTLRNISHGTGDPTGGQNGDIYFKVV